MTARFQIAAVKVSAPDAVTSALPVTNAVTGPVGCERSTTM